jgi:uncharacterized membrane protein (UPF0127 family)
MRPQKKSRVFAVLAFFCAAGIAAAFGGEEQSGGQAALPTITLSINGHNLRAEVAATLQSRRKGLMSRPALADGEAMLLVFPENKRHCLWMRDTLIPLSAAFLNKSGDIVNIAAKMQPQTDRRHCATAPAQYALETSQGWFIKHGIKAGDTIKGLSAAPPPRD